MPRALQIDQSTAADVRALLKRAAARSKDPVLALDELGLLSYPARTRATMAAALREAAQLLDELTVRQLAGVDRQATSPVDMKRQIGEWLLMSASRMEES